MCESLMTSQLVFWLTVIRKNALILHAKLKFIHKQPVEVFHSHWIINKCYRAFFHLIRALQMSIFVRWWDNQFFVSSDIAWWLRVRVNKIFAFRAPWSTAQMSFNVHDNENNFLCLPSMIFKHRLLLWDVGEKTPSMAMKLFSFRGAFSWISREHIDCDCETRVSR